MALVSLRLRHVRKHADIAVLSDYITTGRDDLHTGCCKPILPAIHANTVRHGVHVIQYWSYSMPLFQLQFDVDGL